MSGSSERGIVETRDNYISLKFERGLACVRIRSSYLGSTVFHSIALRVYFLKRLKDWTRKLQRKRGAFPHRSITRKVSRGQSLLSSPLFSSPLLCVTHEFTAYSMQETRKTFKAEFPRNFPADVYPRPTILGESF